MSQHNGSIFTVADRRDLIVIGASAGGVEALQRLIADLPADLPAAVCIVLHLSPEAPSLLPRILRRNSKLPVLHPIDGEPLVAGRVYVATPDHHLLVEDGHLMVTRGPRENRHRPAIDPLFRSAAMAHGSRVIGLILTGALNDGTAGLGAIKRRGGIALVQDPEEALFPGMPTSARRHVAVDHVLTLAAIAPMLTRLAHETPPQFVSDATDDLKVETRWMKGNSMEMERLNAVGTPTSLTCPECHGPLWEVRDEALLRYRCRTGHAFTAESMLAEQAEALEGALWMALNTLEESALVADRLASDATKRQHGHVAARFTEKAHESRRRAESIRSVLLSAQSAAGIDEEALITSVHEDA
jgi:two-component system chemotaxis response regulator CheB